MKRVFFGDDARRRVLGGAEILYQAVSETMGVRGRNAVIGKGYGSPVVTHDGVTVAKAITLPNEDDETLGYGVGAEIIKEAAMRMNDLAGDGTTTVTVLSYHILKEANKLIAAGYNPMVLRRELEEASEAVTKLLTGVSIPVDKSTDRLSEVAEISAGEAEIGKIIADVFKQVGKDGVITVEDGQSLETESEVIEGYTFDRGFLSPLMAPSKGKPEAVLHDPAIIVTDKVIDQLESIVELIKSLVLDKRKDILLIADDVTGEALSLLIQNKIRGNFNVVAVRSPGHGGRRLEYLSDIATLVGGDFLSENNGSPIEEATKANAGSAKKVIVNKDKTTIIGGAGKAEDVKAVIKQIEADKKKTTSAYDKKELDKRRAALDGSVAIIRVGGASETEIEEKKFRVDDAIAAVRCALEDGIVPGGGVTLVRIAEEVEKMGTKGSELLAEALRQPFRKIVSNAGINPDKWLPIVVDADFGMGIDVKHPDGLTNLLDAGVIDPVMVTKKAVQYSVSVAGTNLTMGTLIVDIPYEVNKDVFAKLD